MEPCLENIHNMHVGRMVSKCAAYFDRYFLTADKVLISTDKVLISTDKVLISTDKVLISTDKVRISTDKVLSVEFNNDRNDLVKFSLFFTTCIYS